MIEAFEAWYIDHHSRYPMMRTDKESMQQIKAKLTKVKGGYWDLDTKHQFEAFKAAWILARNGEE